MRKFLAGVLVLLMAAGMLVVFTGCGNNDDPIINEDPVINPLVGTWAWMGRPYYVFNEDGTGTRDASSVFEAAHPLAWTTESGTLTICITPSYCDSVEDCVLPELWSYTIVGDSLTITSQQEAGMTFTYTRVDDTIPTGNNADGVWTGNGFSMNIAPGWSLQEMGSLTVLMAPDFQSSINVMVETIGRISLAEYIEVALELLENTFADFELFDVYFECEDIAFLEYQAIPPGATEVLEFVQAVIHDDNRVFIVTFTDFSLGEDWEMFEDFLDMVETFDAH